MLNNVFSFDNVSNEIKIDDHEILLISEFKSLWNAHRNKTKLDPTGIKRTKAFKELTYMYLMFDYRSPYFEYLEQERHEGAFNDSKLTKEEFEDNIFKKACNKYMELRDSSRVLSLIRTAFRTLEKMRIFLDNIDFTELDGNEKPIYTPKRVLEDIASIGFMREKLKELEISYKKDISSGNTKLRGDSEPGFMDV